ncbi:MAG: DUF971 domain-containing protein [Alphaproteobacteria bacterium]|nr:DUF971 domain-containing protein [Alphaproteobacteria bacterium]
MSGPAHFRSPEVEELRLNRAEARLDVTFTDGIRHSFAAEYLRVESPSAEVQGHGPGQRIIVPGKARVGIAKLEPVGNYAVRIVFDDGHDTGIFSWAYLRELGEEKDKRWADYLRGLEAQGLGREPQ